MDTREQAFSELEFGGKWGKGSYDTRKAGAYLRGTTDRGLSYAFSGRYRESDGYRKNGLTRQGDVGLTLGYSLGERVQIGLSTSYHKDDSGNPGALQLSEERADRRNSTKPYDFNNNPVKKMTMRYFRISCRPPRRKVPLAVANHVYRPLNVTVTASHDVNASFAQSVR